MWQSIQKQFKWRYIPIVLLVIGLIAAAGFVLWANATPELMSEATIALVSDANVTVNRDDGWIEFISTASPPTTGYIIYPGGRVPAEAYAPLARAIADDGYFVAIVPVTLNLAIFNTGAAAPVIAAHPEIESWAVGGHSLGGVAASGFAHDNPDEIDGLVLMASQSYPGVAHDNDPGLIVVSIYGTKDGLQTEADIDASKATLPSDTEYVAIEGGNHAQFGWYGEQAGDNPATISRATQTMQIVEATVNLLQNIAN